MLWPTVISGVDFGIRNVTEGDRCSAAGVSFMLKLLLLYHEKCWLEEIVCFVI